MWGCSPPASHSTLHASVIHHVLWCQVAGLQAVLRLTDRTNTHLLLRCLCPLAQLPHQVPQSCTCAIPNSSHCTGPLGHPPTAQLHSQYHLNQYFAPPPTWLQDSVELFCNGKPMTPARYPNQGWLRILDATTPDGGLTLPFILLVGFAPPLPCPGPHGLEAWKFQTSSPPSSPHPPGIPGTPSPSDHAPAAIKCRCTAFWGAAGGVLPHATAPYFGFDLDLDP